MATCRSLPELPETLEGLSGEEQARLILDLWGRTGDIYSECAIRHEGLVEWINHGE